MTQYESSKVKLNLVACGYLRKYFNVKNIDPIDIVGILVKCLHIDWKFDYFCDIKDRGQESGIHGIYNNGKTSICRYEGGCPCFYRVSFEMRQNLGIYKIKFKINNMNNEVNDNMIGITCNTHKTNNSQSMIFGFILMTTLVGQRWKQKMTQMYQMV